MLINLFENFERKYFLNKNLLKDSKPQTINAFMNNFFEDYLNEKIESIIKNDFEAKEILNFLNAKIQIENRKYLNKNSSENENELMHFGNNNDDILTLYSMENIKDRLILKTMFFERIILIYSNINKNDQLSSNIEIKYLKEIKSYCKIFFENFNNEFSSQNYILLNISEFKFFFRKILKILLETSKDIVEFNDSFLELLNHNSIFKEIHQNLYFLFYSRIMSKKQIKFSINEHLCNHNPEKQTEYSEYFEKFENLIEFVFECFKNLKNLLNTQSESIINKINNEIITVFKKLWVNLINKLNYKKEEDYWLMQKYLNKFINSKIHLIKENYEIYIFIYDFYFRSFLNKNEIIIMNLNEINDDSNKSETAKEQTKKLILLKSILENNTPALHRFSLSFLKEISLLLKAEKIKTFIEKFIILYDVLDGFNSHLFKQLVKELIFIIEYCEKENYEIHYQEKIDFFEINKKDNEINIMNIFKASINYFYILANKIFSHENSRIQKFFIKTFSQLSKEKGLKNPNFENFLFKIFMKSINNPLFYPENENIGYHAKLGLVIENVFTSWFLNILNSDSKIRFIENLERYLYAISNYIELRKILGYLINVIRNIFYENFYVKKQMQYSKMENLYNNNIVPLTFDLYSIRSELKNKFSEFNKLSDYSILKILFEMLRNINNIISKHFKYLSVYVKNNAWENICLIFFEIEIFPINENCLKDIQQTDLKLMMKSMEIEYYKFIENYLDYYVLKENTLSSLVNSDKDFILNIYNKKYNNIIFDKKEIFRNFFKFTLSKLNTNIKGLSILNELTYHNINIKRNISTELIENFIEKHNSSFNITLSFSTVEKILLLCIYLSSKVKNQSLLIFSLEDTFYEFSTKLVFSSYLSEKEKNFKMRLLLNYFDLIASFSTIKSDFIKETNLINMIECIFINLNTINDSSNRTLCGDRKEIPNEISEGNIKQIYFLGSFITNTENLFLNSNSVENKYILNNFSSIEKILLKSVVLLFSELNEGNYHIIKDVYDVLYTNTIKNISFLKFNNFFISNEKILEYLNESDKNVNEVHKFLNSLLLNFEFITRFTSTLETTLFIFWKKILELIESQENLINPLQQFLHYSASEENLIIYISILNEKLNSYFNLIEDFLIKNEKYLLSDKLHSFNKNPYMGDYSSKNNTNIDKTTLNINIFTNIRSNLIKIKYFSSCTFNIIESIKNFKANQEMEYKLKEFFRNIYCLNSKELNNIEDVQFSKSHIEVKDKADEIILKQYSDNLSIDYLIKNSKRMDNKISKNQNENTKEISSIKQKINFDLISIMFYLENLLEYLEKCSEEVINYVFDLISFGINFILENSNDLNKNLEEYIIPYLSNVKNVGFNLLIDKREYLTYFNVKSYLKIFVKKQLFNSEKFKIEVFSSLMYTIKDLNEKRTWLLIKVMTEELINIVSIHNLSLSNLKGLELNILDLSEAKETRGDDSFMLKVVPNFLYSPFNLKKIFNKFSNLNNLKIEQISKYGVFIRWAISKLFEKKIIYISEQLLCLSIENFLNILDEIEFLLSLMNKILIVIDKNSSSKSEMQFTTKHRKKLRLSQFLVIISRTFTFVKTKFSSDDFKRLLECLDKEIRASSLKKIEQCNEIIENLNNLNIKLFEKINLYSVKFYLDLFSLNLSYSSKNFFNYLLMTLQNPLSKTHCVSSAMIILSVLFLEALKAEESFEIISEKDFGIFFEILISLCTSNVCNIRGFAQYFVYKFSQIFEKIDNNKNRLLELFQKNLSTFTFSNIFINYLNKNSNIQKFFKKFDESFDKFIDIYNNYTFENIISKNFDEIHCEIIPLDILNDFKELGMKMIKLENEDFTKPNISWKWGLCPELMESVLQTEKLGSKKAKKLNLECSESIKEILTYENNQIKNRDYNDNQINKVEKEHNEIMQLDFQKKYRPGENLKLDALNNDNNSENNKNYPNSIVEKIDYEIDENSNKLLEKKRKRLDIVIMSSLVDKAPNLGGLARTCEVFNLGCMTICSEAFLNDNAFLTAAASAEKWLPLINLPVCDIEIFLISYKKLGYKIIGLEQTANSITLREFKFTEKIVIVLGNEKEGIPQNIINMIDHCVIIPQFGEIRSLNVHVSAALMLWEIVNSVNN